ncbi:hypothetical protein LAZ67_21001338, partial [Cordylochernes scorpioides]
MSSHLDVMCTKLILDRGGSSKSPTVQDETLANLSTSPDVLLPTLRVTLKGNRKGSQRSYILHSTAMEMEYKQSRREFFRHSLFGGSSTNVVEHEVYTIHLSDINNSYRCEFEALGQPLICGSIPPVCPRSFLEGSEELDVSDLRRDRIEVLIGADIAGRLLTDAHRRISSGLVAIRTKLGWTVMGKIPPTEARDDTSSLCVTTLLSLDLEILWKLDAIGVSDAEVEKKNQSLQAEMEEHFAHNTTRDIEERYEVALPWVQDKERIPTNRDLAENQLSSVRRKLEEVGDMKEYGQIFEECINQGIIEYSREDKLDGVHNLPHRPVYKRNSQTSKIRPVFNASSRKRDKLSLKDCPDNGTNFRGMANTLKKIDFLRLKCDPTLKNITWKFIPTGAPWWGGWWERLIGMMKQLLFRILGQTSLGYEELSTRQETRRLKTTIPFKVGDMVLIGQESLMRLHWPLARIIQLYPGKDGLVRVVKVKTSSAEENNWNNVLFNPTIMPPKRSAIGRSTNQAKRRREYRASETSEQRQARQERVQVHTTLARSLETSEQRQARQERNRVHTALARSLEMSEQSQARQERDRIRRTQTRRTMHTDLNLCGFIYNPYYNYSLHPSVIIGKMDKRYAPGGTGITFLISIILATIRSQNNIALAIASSGIAATILDGGRTAHSALKLPLNMQVIETPTCNISKYSGMGKVLRSCQLIIWGECTMAHKKSLEALNRTLKDLRGNEQLFGGALILLTGDFRQTLPVIPRSTPADELNACLKESVLWRYVEKISSKTNMRVQLQQDESSERFAKQLLDIGKGRMEMDESTHCIILPENFCHFEKFTDDFIAKVFPNLSQNYKNNHWVNKRAILSAKHIDVNLINCTIQNEIPEEVTTYKSIDTVVNPDESVNYPIEFLNSLDLPGMPPYILSLKIGSPIILLRNINPPRLCNGTRLSVKKLMNN